MRMNLDSAEIFVPDGLPVEQALARTTHMAISAHQDDIEIMAAAPILECFQRANLWFTGVVVTDGRGSPRDDIYKSCTDEDMRLIRFKEQKKAAFIGEYAAQVLLDYPSKTVKDPANPKPVEDIAALLLTSRPKIVYTHNLADKHDTHVAVALRVIAAIRSLPLMDRPSRLFACEVWRSLDWMADTEKILFDLSNHENLQAALLGVFDSQIVGGKRYDLASMGHRKSNATFFESHGVDTVQGLSIGMDMTPLIQDETRDIASFIQQHIDTFARDVSARLERVGDCAE